MPDSLSRKLKKIAAERNTSMRELIVDAVSRSLEAPASGFRLRDASTGPFDSAKVDAGAINQAIDAQREPAFRL